MGGGRSAARRPGVNGGRRNDQLQILAPGEQTLQMAEQKINIQAAFVRLVEDDRVVFREGGVALGFRQQNAVGHHLDVSLGAGPIVKPICSRLRGP